METKGYSREDNYIRAKKKVEAIKGFYWHLIIYIAINGFITGSSVISNMADGANFISSIWDISTFFTWVPWGLGLLIHGLIVFDAFTFLLGRGWEQRKMKELMDKDSNDINSL